MSIAYWCVLIAAFLPYLVTYPAKATREYDNSDPRGWAERQTGFRKRAIAAHLNAFEAFPFFAVAVIVAGLNKADPAWVDRLAMLFILARLAHAGAYYANQGTLRSLAWLVGFGAAIAIYLSPVWSV